jgi:transposase
MQQRFVGVDLGIRTKHRVSVLDGSVRRGKPFSVEVSRAGFDEFLKRATEGAEGKVKIVLEPTGLAWVPLAAYATDAGHEVCLVKPQKAKQLRKFLRQHTKSDSVDSETLARLPQVDPNGVQPLVMPTAQQMTLRRLIRRRERLAEQIGDQKRRIHALMIMANPPLMAALGESAFGQGALAFFRKYADPAQAVRAGVERLRKFWRKRSKGQASPDLPERVFEACRIAADLYCELRQKDKLPFSYAEIQEELAGELDLMDYLQREVERLNGRIAEIYAQMDPDRTLEKQLPGIGAVIAPAIEALVGNISRFSNPRKFVAYTGLCPRKKQTGVQDQPMPMTKAGNKLFKKYLYLAAHAARLLDPDFAAYYAERYARGIKHNKIMIALGHKMALRIFAVLKRREAAKIHQQNNHEPVTYVLRDCNGKPLSKKEARDLVVTKYSRAKANPSRYRQDQARTEKATGGRKKTESATAAYVEWPSKDATDASPTPPSSLPLPPPRRPGKPSTRPSGWESTGDILRRFLENMGVEKL